MKEFVGIYPVDISMYVHKDIYKGFSLQQLFLKAKNKMGITYVS